MSEPWNDELPVGGRGWVKRALEAEKQVQAVRDKCSDQCFWAQIVGDSGLVNAVSVESILEALDGER